MKQYLDLLRDVYENGTAKEDRTGTGTRSVFGRTFRHDMNDGFPLLTTKRVFWKGVVAELLWMLNGGRNAKDLEKQGVNIWREWRRPFDAQRELVLVDARSATLPADYDGSFSCRLNLPEGEDRKLGDIWKKMMRRCYDLAHHRYYAYGAIGVTVHPEWHDPAVFIEGVKKIPHWPYKRANWSEFELDKDYFGSFQYGPSTSVWLSKGENNKYTKAARPLVARTPEETERTFLTVGDLAEGIGMSRSSAYRLLNDGPPMVFKGGNKQFAGWEIVPAKLNGKLLRKELIPEGDLGPIYGHQWRSWGGVDQIKNALDELEHNPWSRRHLVSAWNVGELDAMGLPPCHYAFQFNVRPANVDHEGLSGFDDLPINERPRALDLQMHMRSADIFLGVPFNIASYALMLLMFANRLQYQPGDLIVTFGDLHLYNNHVEQAQEQLSREPRELPEVHFEYRAHGAGLLPWHYVPKDIILDGYDPHPPIKGEVSV